MLLFKISNIKYRYFQAYFTFNISVWRYVQEWTDANMRWNTSEYSDIKDIRLPPARLWKPDILMYNRSVLCALHSTSPDMQAVFDNLR